MIAAVTATPGVPAPRPPAEPARRPRRERPREQYWNVFEARWQSAGGGLSRRGGPAAG
jgi:hypothetical protein